MDVTNMLEGGLPDIFTSLQLDADGDDADLDNSASDNKINIELEQNNNNGSLHEEPTTPDEAGGAAMNDNSSKRANGEASGSRDKDGNRMQKNQKKKVEDPSLRSVTTVSTGECTLDVDFHGIIPEGLERLRHRKLRATFSFVPNITGTEGTLVIMKAVNTKMPEVSEEMAAATKKPAANTDFPMNMEYLVRRQPHDYPKLYMEPLTEIEVGILMNYPRESYRPISLNVGWLHWKSGRFRAQDPHNHIPITGLDGSCVDVREIYREVTRQFSAYCQDRRVRTISFRSDQEVFFALGFYCDSRDARFFIRRLVDDSGNVLTFYQFLLLHDSLQPGRKRLYVWTATRRKTGRRNNK